MSRSLRIGVLGVRGIPSTYSGYETFLTVLLPELVERGHEVTCYSRDPDAEPSWKGVRIQYLPSLSTKSLETLSHSAIATMRARLSGNHDVLLTCNVATALFSGFAKFTGLPVVMNVDGVEWDRGKWGTGARKIFRFAARLSKYSATTLIADCPAMAEIYDREFGADSVVIPYCWTGLTDTLDADGRRRRVEDFGLAPGKYCVVAGRMNPENNMGPIAASYAKSTFDMPLVVLGAANYESPVYQEIDRLSKTDDRIQFRGHVDDRQLYGALLAEAAVMFHGHSVGGMNPGLVEAMGSGALIAAFDTPFNRDTLAGTGLFFQDPDRAAAQTETALAATDADGLRRDASHRARSEFSLESVAGMYEAALCDVLALPKS